MIFNDIEDKEKYFIQPFIDGNRIKINISYNNECILSARCPDRNGLLPGR